MPILPEVHSDFDRLKALIESANRVASDTGEAESMIYEYLCVAITGKLEQNLKCILINYANNSSKRAMGAAISKLCQSFQNPDKEKILSLLSLFDKEYADKLKTDWVPEDSHGNAISDMVGMRKTIAHQTSNSRNMTRTKIERYFNAYKETVTEISEHFY